ncbi:MAG: bifunctional protein-serine/threonine kinase/phosphatase [Nitrosomonadales bacterium]|nr:MAG: bifunctional protein-serine/threonine kinase/phosphatase [Nitrosomonadales bacterium]
MPLKFKLGQASETGPRARNEDYCGAVTPTAEVMAAKGALFAVADGVSGGAGGREAAELTVRGLLSDYYATPDTWEVTAALDKVIAPLNRWVVAQGAANRDLAGMASTLSLLVLRGTRYILGHVGDTRIYRLRGNTMSQLTVDHVWERPDMRHVLKRAIGLDAHIAMDYSEGTAQAGDLFLLASDGVWEPLGEPAIHQTLLLHRESPQRIAEELVRKALVAGGQDNATALAVRVEELPKEDMGDLLAEGKQLRPPKKKLAPGMLLDEFEIVAVLHESRATLVYLARHKATGQPVVLKTLQPLLADDPVSCNGLLQEEWLAKRVVAHYFPQVLPCPTRSELYYAMTWHKGENLAQKLSRGHYFTAVEAAGIGIRLLKGLGALHRLNILHRDIKPDNLHLGDDGRLRILDMGVAVSLGLGQEPPAPNAGTPSYLAPELFADAAPSVASDLYSAGVTLYYLLTRHYPYGEIEPFQHPRFGAPVPPTRYRPDLPGWLENILLKACARDPEARFETAEEFLLALERGEHQPILPPPRMALAQRNPLQLWQAIAALSLVVNLLLVYLIVVS